MAAPAKAALAAFCWADMLIWVTWRQPNCQGKVTRESGTECEDKQEVDGKVVGCEGGSAFACL
eukprot:252230-Rhodomonas_salina.1